MLERLDGEIFAAFYAGQPSAMGFAVMVALTIAGSGWSMIALVPLLALQRTRRFAASLTATLLVAATLVFALKQLVGRARPFVALPGVRALWEAPHDYSFPSGHATGSFCFAVFVATLVWLRHRRERRRVAIAVVCLGLAAGIAASRVYLGVHFPGDVLAGALIGTGIGAAGAWTHVTRVSRD